MEALAIFGGAAAAMTLTCEIVKVGKRLTRVAQSIKSARKDIGEVTTELEVFSELFNHFLETFKTGPDYTPTPSFSPELLIKWIQRAIGKLKYLLKRVEALQRGRSRGYSLPVKLAGRLIWYYSRHSVKLVQDCFQVARISISAYTNIHHIEGLKLELAWLEKAVEKGQRAEIEARHSMPVEQLRRIIEKRLRFRRSHRHDLHHRLEAAKAKVALQRDKDDGVATLELNTLFEFTKVVEDYVAEVVPLRKVGNPRASQARSTRQDALESEYTHLRMRKPIVPKSPEAPKSSKSYSSIAKQQNKPLDLPPVSKVSTRHKKKTVPSRLPSDAWSLPKDCSLVWSSSAVISGPLSGSEITTSTASTTATGTTKSNSTRHRQPFDGRLRASRGEYINNPEGTILCPPIRAKSKSRVARHSTVNNITPDQDLSANSRITQEKGHSEVSDEKQRTGQDENKSDSDAEPDAETSEQAQRPSPFQPVAGFQGEYPSGWHQRDKRSESPQDFW